MFLGQTKEFLHVLRKQAKHNQWRILIKERTSLLAIDLLIHSILRRNKLEIFHEDTVSRPELDRKDYLFFSLQLFTARYRRGE